MKKNKALAVPFVLWAILFIAVPLVMVVWYGVTVEETPAYVEVEGIDGQTMFQLEDGTLTAERPEKQTVVSLANFKRMLEPTYLKLLLRSLKIALFTTILCLLLGYPVALILSGRDFKRPGLWLMLIILPMWMNFLLRTYSWMSILENSGILNSWIASLRDAIPAFDRWLTSMGVGKKIIFLYNENAVVLGMVYNYLSFMIMPIYTVIEKTDHSLLEAAPCLRSWATFSATRSRGSPFAMAIIVNLRPSKRRSIFSGISLSSRRQGLHQVAQKDKSTTSPRHFEILTSRPSSISTVMAGTLAPVRKPDCAKSGNTRKTKADKRTESRFMGTCFWLSEAKITIFPKLLIF